jgi:predicted ATP-grasp superfamily ATP-dependent carboligase
MTTEVAAEHSVRGDGHRKGARVLVTDGDERPALAVTRSLGRRGIEVLVGAENERSLASSSRYCSGRVGYPSPYREPEEFCRFLLDLARRRQIDVLIPITDVTTHIVARHKAELEDGVRLPVPDFSAFDFVSDKWKLLRHAQERGIAIPRTYFLQGADSLGEVLGKLRYPVVVKPARSRVLTESGWMRTQVRYAGSETELISLYGENAYLRLPSLIQERVNGPGIGLFLLFDRGRLVTAFSHRRLREKPPSGGVSTLRESIPVDLRLKSQAVDLFGALGWHGVAMVEYKLDRRSGEPLLMEVNGRFWGSLQLAIDAGMDFPYLLYRLAVDGCVQAPAAYKIGVRNRWLLGDVDHALARLFKKDRDLDLPEGFPSRFRTAVEFAKVYRRGQRYEPLSLTDPMPFLHELSEYLRDLFRERSGITRG